MSQTHVLYNRHNKTVAVDFSLSIRIYYEDTDAGGVVYYANYLKYMERARTEWLRAQGLEQDALMRDLGVVFVVRRVEIDYLKPARFNDVVNANIMVCEAAKASLRFKQDLTRAEETLARAVVKVACVAVDDFRPCAIPEVMVKMLQQGNI